jgi:hypothetical protein
VQRSIPKAIQDGVATEPNQRHPDQLAIAERKHAAKMQVAERADSVVGDHPTRRVQQQAREREALLLVERQSPVPTLRTIERGARGRRGPPAQARRHGGLLEAAGLGGIAHSRAQRAER